MARAWRREASRSRGRLGRIAAIALTAAAGLLLVLAGAARGAEATLPMPGGLAVEGGEDWHAENDFDLSWTNPAELAVVGASWRLASWDPSVGYLGSTQFTAGAELSALADVHVPVAGRYVLAVWLRDASGWEDQRLAATANLWLDDAAPAVAFVAAGSEQPPLLVANVADPLSGVADGTISYRRLDEQRWTDLPTAIRAGALGTELAATAPELKPGTAYLFQAEALDAAGNVATTSQRADGSPMALRVPKDADVADPGRDIAATARPVRLLAALGGGARRGRTELTVDSGEGAVLRGRLELAPPGAAAGPDLAGRRIRVVARPARGSSAEVSVSPLETGGDGRFELRLPPGPSRRIVVVFAGGDGLGPARRRLDLRVRAAVSLTAAPRRLRTGGTLRLGGRVGSRVARVPRAGKLVTISYWETTSRRWRPVIVTRTDRAGRFRAGYRFRYVSGRARIRLRATAPAEAEWPYAPGSSRPLTVAVRGR